MTVTTEGDQPNNIDIHIPRKIRYLLVVTLKNIFKSHPKEGKTMSSCHFEKYKNIFSSKNLAVPPLNEQRICVDEEKYPGNRDAQILT